MTVTLNNRKNMLRNVFIAMGVVALATCAQAQILDNFDSGLGEWTRAAWSATGPDGWGGGASLQATNTAGGWTMGGGGGPMREYGSTEENATMRALADSGAGRLSLDVILDGTSFPAGQQGWYQINMAGNSDGSAGWTQVEKITGDGWHNADDATLFTWHVDVAFSDVGWEAGDTWFQLWLGANSAGDFPVQFYIDNVQVPEPTSFALTGLGAAALLLFRRRR